MHYADMLNFLQVDLDSKSIVTGVQTQGDPRSENWLTSYSIGYADTCDSLVFTYIGNAEGQVKVSRHGPLYWTPFIIFLLLVSFVSSFSRV
jgi:hypothetical protein